MNQGKFCYDEDPNKFCLPRVSHQQALMNAYELTSREYIGCDMDLPIHDDKNTDRIFLWCEGEWCFIVPIISEILFTCFRMTVSRNESLRRK